jgi:3D (Asp-Asp-Asp) domain-containing protein
MSKSLLGGSAVAALFSVSLIFYAAPSIAETLSQATHKPATQQQTIITAETAPIRDTSDDAELNASAAETNGAIVRSRLVSTDKLRSSQPETNREAATSITLSPSQAYVATAYSLRGRTASGLNTIRGIIAADRKLLPLGTRVRLDAGVYSGEYLVADTGGAVRGRKIDIWVPNTGEAMRFGRRTVKLTVLTHERGNRTTAQRARH